MEVALLVLRLATIVALYAFLALIVILLWRDVRQASLRESTSATRERSACLVVLEGAEGMAVGDVYPLKPYTSLGRAPTNLIELTDSYCSAEHALIVWRGGQWWLEDRDSRNGTSLNGEPLDRPAVLSAGDLIGMGRVRLRFDIDAGVKN